MAIAIPGAALALSAGNGNAMAVSSPWALTLGVALVVLANIAWTLYSAFARQWLPTWPSVAMTTATIAAGGLLFAAGYVAAGLIGLVRFKSEEQTSELQSLMRSSYAVFCLKKTKRQ